MSKLGFLFNPEGNMPSKEVKSKDIVFDFLGLLTETADGKDNKFNGAIKFYDDHIYVEKRSRLNGKVKDSFNIDYSNISEENIQRVGDTKIQFDLNDRNLILKTLDDNMLDKFEERLKNKLNTGSFEIDEKATAKPVVADIPAEIRKYHDLLKDGIITEEEFETKKKELLNS